MQPKGKRTGRQRRGSGLSAAEVVRGLVQRRFHQRCQVFPYCGAAVGEFPTAKFVGSCQACVCQFVKPLRKHAAGHRTAAPSELTEPECTYGEFVDDVRHPAPTEQVENGGCLTMGRFAAHTPKASQSRARSQVIAPLAFTRSGGEMAKTVSGRPAAA